MNRSLLAAVAALGILSAAGCGSGGSTGTSPGSPVITPQTAKVAFVVKIPVKTSSAIAKRHTSYVASDTRSVTFAYSTDGGSTFSTPPQVVAIDVTNSSTCPVVGGYYNCSAYFTAPIGAIKVRVMTYASTDGTGSVLSRSIVDKTIVEGADNEVDVTLDGVVATLTIALSPTSVSVGTPHQDVTATWGGQDAAGNTIVVPPGNLVDSSGAALAPTLAITNAPSAFTAGAVTTYTFVEQYNGTSIADQTFTLSDGTYTNATATLTVGPLPALSVTPTSLQFLNTDDTKDVTISETGYGSGTFTITTSSGCSGVITVPASVTASSGSATLTVTPVAVGGVSPACTITVTDSYSQTTNVTATVTASHGVIQ